ncbi:helix-turn-helix transcriptional regulator [Acrocarpospora corrugata]|uniref:Helix-turn-helix transcriptional regulator n=1 Tax=Acrocarpospora corrugata TaxID=35763 RepID=A0A5M3W6K5_9ACTN|nr:LuxR family transcriptional regulator [Acrocarpospora corrugata]GES03910.1 helix-turn-helix transcriptional regulator [Acrocarpospora corrugata]
MLRGRSTEQATVRRLLDDAASGSGGALLFHGAAGTGKSALLDHAAGLFRQAGRNDSTELFRHAGRDDSTGPFRHAGRDTSTGPFHQTGQDDGAGLSGHAGGDNAAAPGPFLMLRARGIAAESGLPFAGLHCLLRPLARDVPALPPVQGAALTDALERGVDPGALLVPAAVVNLLCSAGRPVLACVDDLHLMDAPSRDALLFAARRLSGERVAMVFTAAADLAGIPSARLENLDERARRDLVDDLAPELSDGLRAAVDQIAGGNPLAVTEVVAALTPAQLAGHAAPPTALPPEGRLFRRYADQAERLPGRTRAILLLLAADPDLDLPALVRAAEPDCAFAGLEAAEQAGLVRITGDRCAFVEPNLATVVYRRATSLRRRAAHRRLAEVLGGDGQALRRAWHRAAALDGPSAALGDELAAAANAHNGQSATVGAYAGRPELSTAAGPHAGHPSLSTAASPHAGYPGLSAAFERAAELSPCADVRAARLATAAQHARLEGRPYQARMLLDRLRSGTISEELRQQAELIGARLELRGGATASARDDLLAVAAALLGRDRTMAVRALVRAGEASYLAGDHQRFVAIARDAAELRRPDDCPATRLMFEYLTGLAASFRGRHAEAAGPLRRVVELAPSVHSPSVLVWAACASLMLGDDVQALRLSTRAVETAKARGAISTVPQVLEFATHSEFWMGRYPAVTANAAEGLRLAQETGQRNSAGQHLAWLAMMAAVRGDEETCRTRAEAAIDLAGAHGVGLAGALSTWALACLDLSRGNAAAVVQRLRPTRNGHLVVRVTATPTLVEAAVRTGDRERAEAALAVFGRWVDSTRSPDRLALAVRCRALLAAPGDAEDLYREALDLHRRGFSEFETARTELLFGNALRRDRRPGAAREHLHGALDTFERFGARLWAEQSRNELRATGEAVPSTRPAPTGDLTAQQLQIARLVADGATNREVAARLYLSPRTIEHHLRNIFAKLDIRSRVELVRLLS